MGTFFYEWFLHFYLFLVCVFVCSESLGESIGKKWSQIWNFLLKNGVKLPQQKSLITDFHNLFTPFKGIFAPTYQSSINIFFPESLEKSNGKKWSEILKLFLIKGLQLPRKKSLFFGKLCSLRIFPYFVSLSSVTYHLSPVTCNLSPITCQLSPTTCYLGDSILKHLENMTIFLFGFLTNKVKVFEVLVIKMFFKLNFFYH